MCDRGRNRYREVSKGEVSRDREIERESYTEREIQREEESWREIKRCK